MLGLLSLSPIIFEYLYFFFNFKNAVFKLILSYFLGYSHQPTPNFEFSMEKLSWYIMYVITNLFHEFRTPNLIAKYHMVVLTLADQVAKGC